MYIFRAKVLFGKCSVQYIINNPNGVRGRFHLKNTRVLLSSPRLASLQLLNLIYLLTVKIR